MSCLTIGKEEDPFQNYSQNPIGLIKEYINLSLKYKDSSIFQKFPYEIDMDSALETFLTGSSVEGISYEFRDFLSKCLEVKTNKKINNSLN